jgi:sterol desaturase/sphingolipid hydroxylase (fatty acid hydroxylase superfamily)
VDFVSDLVSFVLGLAALDKAVVKEFLFANGLGSLWEVFRASLFHPFVIVSVVTCVLMERLWSVQRRERLITAGMLLDYLYPLLSVITFSAAIEAAIVTGIVSLYHHYLPFLRLDLLSHLPWWLQAVGYFLVVDFVFYCSHYFHHKVTVLWYLHAVHHSQEDLNPFTTYRGHQLESATKTIVRTMPFMIFGGTETTVFWFTFINSFWGFFIHSNIRLNLGPLKYVLVTPQYHRVHHSIEERHFDKNFGERLTLWDWLFGTMWPHFEDYPATGVKNFPIPREADRSPMGLLKSWWGLTFYPFRRMWMESRRLGETGRAGR